MSDHPNAVETGRRRMRLLALAGAVGFVGRGGITASPWTLALLLLGLFAVVFLVTLLLSVLRGEPMVDPLGEAAFRPTLADVSQVPNEAVLGSP